MTAWQKAEEVYRKEFCPRTLLEDFNLHLENPHGCAIKLPGVVALARPVDRNGYPTDIIDPSLHFCSLRWDCWHIYLLVGDAAAAWKYLPFELDWMSYERRNVLRIAPFCRMKSLLCHDLRPTNSSK
jgi:hypothetical protein